MNACRYLIALLSLSLLGATPAPVPVPAPAPLKLWRLDCGRIAVRDLDAYSDTRAYVGRSGTLVVSCYLIRHGSDWMLWETGLPEQPVNDPADSEQAEQTSTLVGQLAALGVSPADISIVGLSHYHYDHTGQAARFPNARLLIGRADAEAIRQVPRRGKALAPWFAGDGSDGPGAGRLDPVTGDRDVFGDGRVVMLDLPGHTPGHHGLLVSLANKGPVLLTGDATHFRENYDSDGVPSFNTNRADSLASLDRLRKLAANLRAPVVIQHDVRDIGTLRAFPAAND